MPWVRADFEKLFQGINRALGVNIVLAFVYMAYDEPPFKAATQIMVNLIAIVVLMRTLQVYPFDFSAYDFPIVVSAIDNLAKGAASQGIQAMNLCFGFPETLGLLPESTRKSHV